MIHGNLAPEGTASTKKSVPGIGASNDTERLLTVLSRLGLCPSDIVDPLTRLAAAGQPIKQHYTCSVWDLDQALKDVDCSLEQRLAFKTSLKNKSLLSVPK